MLRGLWSRLRRGRRHVHEARYDWVLGTSLDLRVVGSRRAAGPEAERAALGEIGRLEKIFSLHADTSELARWQETLDEEVDVSAELAEVLRAADGWRRRTGGAFDPAAEAVARALRDGVAPPDLPEPDAPLWRVERSGGRWSARRLTRLATTLDAIAKGYIIDRACAAAQGVDGVDETLLNVGGDVRHLGEGAVAVGIADFFVDAENTPPAAVVRVRGEGVATSGGLRRGFRIGERWVSHLVDPRAARPAERVAGASVIAPSAADADALATAFSVLAPDRSLALADSLPGVGCLVVAADGERFVNAVWRERVLS